MANQTECAAIARVKKAVETISNLIREELKALEQAFPTSLTGKILSVSIRADAETAERALVQMRWGLIPAKATT
jgi:putative SOS response-associated peptidase YedK